MFWRAVPLLIDATMRGTDAPAGLSVTVGYPAAIRNPCHPPTVIQTGPAAPLGDHDPKIMFDAWMYSCHRYAMLNR